jgi:hypothetical protein
MSQTEKEVSDQWVKVITNQMDKEGTGLLLMEVM